jgi:hypothetical protein
MKDGYFLFFSKIERRMFFENEEYYKEYFEKVRFIS